jgi:hypothetical protein
VSDRIRRYVDVDKTLPLTNLTSFISSSSARLPTSSDHLFSEKWQKGRKGNGYATGYISHSFVTNWTKS